MATAEREKNHALRRALTKTVLQNASEIRRGARALSLELHSFLFTACRQNAMKFVSL